MGCFRAPPPWRKTAPQKRPIKRSMIKRSLSYPSLWVLLTVCLGSVPGTTWGQLPGISGTSRPDFSVKHTDWRDCPRDKRDISTGQIHRMVGIQMWRCLAKFLCRYWLFSLPPNGPYPQYGWDFPEEIPEKFRKDPGNALRVFPEILLKSTAGNRQTL